MPILILFFIFAPSNLLLTFKCQIMNLNFIFFRLAITFAIFHISPFYLTKNFYGYWSSGYKGYNIDFPLFHYRLELCLEWYDSMTSLMDYWKGKFVMFEISFNRSLWY